MTTDPTTDDRPTCEGCGERFTPDPVGSTCCSWYCADVAEGRAEES